MPSISSWVQAKMSKFFFRNSTVFSFSGGSSSPHSLVVFEGSPITSSTSSRSFAGILLRPSTCDSLWRLLILLDSTLELAAGLHVFPQFHVGLRTSLWGSKSRFQLWVDLMLVVQGSHCMMMHSQRSENPPILLPKLDASLPWLIEKWCLLDRYGLHWN